MLQKRKVTPFGVIMETSRPRGSPKLLSQDMSSVGETLVIDLCGASPTHNATQHRSACSRARCNAAEDDIVQPAQQQHSTAAAQHSSSTAQQQHSTAAAQQSITRHSQFETSQHGTTLDCPLHHRVRSLTSAARQEPDALLGVCSLPSWRSAATPPQQEFRRILATFCPQEATGFLQTRPQMMYQSALAADASVLA